MRLETSRLRGRGSIPWLLTTLLDIAKYWPKLLSTPQAAFIHGRRDKNQTILSKHLPNSALDVRHLDIFIIQILGHHLKDDLLLVLGNWLLRDELNQLAEWEIQSFLEFGGGEEGCVQQTNARAHHGNVQAPLLKVCNQLLESDVVDLESVPNFIESHLAVRSPVLDLWTGNRLAEAKEWQCKIDEAILVLLNVVLAINDLVKLEDDQTCHQSRGGGNGRNDLASNKLGLVSIGLFNLVILGAQVACGGDEVNVMICVIVLLEFNGCELEASHLASRRQVLCDILKLVTVVKAAGSRIL